MCQRDKVPAIGGGQVHIQHLDRGERLVEAGSAIHGPGGEAAELGV